MANKNLFKSIAGKLLPQANARNAQGAPSYALSPEQALAQYACTGCLNATYYASASMQLDTLLALCRQAPAGLVAKTAVYARRKGHMKDAPALLAAHLAATDVALLERVFDRVIDNGKMLRNFVQVVRSGVTGRKSLGTVPRRLVRRFLASRSDDAVLEMAVGQSPSLADIVRLAHPRPATDARRALYGWLLGRSHDASVLPDTLRAYEAFRNGEALEVPDVPWQMLTALPLSTADWRVVAERAGWQMTRMNLRTFARHGIFDPTYGTGGEAARITRVVAARLADREAIARARAFPYQLMQAWQMADDDIPGQIHAALETAMEIAVENVPRIDGKVYVFPDVSGSMRSPVTGQRQGSTSAVRCVDVAALVAAAILRKNPTAEVVPFEQDVVDCHVDGRLGIAANAAKLARIGGGGTSCSAPLALLNQRRAKGDAVIYVSDNESWVDAGRGRGTATMQEWMTFKKRNPSARMVCLDLQPNRTTQAAEGGDVLNVGGFSDDVFEVMAAFLAGRMSPEHWVGRIAEVEI